MAGRLAGKLALVTGAASGIGKAVCEIFAKEGAVVIGAGLNDVSATIKDLPSVADKCHLHLDVDVSKEDQVSKMMMQILEHYQCSPTLAVNCAGITRDGFLVKMKEEDFDEVINVNLKGTFFVTKHLGQHLMKEKVDNASIINVASIVGKVGNIGQANYAASKAGVIALTKTTALEFARYGIRCNTILPGFITTPMTEKVPPQIQEGIRSMIPLGVFGKPEDIANTCLFLASDESRYITGASIEVTGGLFT